MTTQPNRRRTNILILAIALVQIFDVTIHAATDQLEPIRVASNVIILAWLGLVAGGRGGIRSISSGMVGGYLLLNLLFLAQEGITNPAQGGALRVMLLVLIALTEGLSAWLIYRSTNR